MPKSEETIIRERIDKEEAAPNAETIQLRSEELQDVIGMIPHWIVRWGITAIFAVVLLLFVGSFVFHYPDIVPAEIVITGRQPPATIIARSGGKIQHLLVKDKQLVGAGDYIAVLENTAELQHVLALKKKLAIDPPLDGGVSVALQAYVNEEWQLGELQADWEAFKKSLADYVQYLRLDYHGQRIRALTEQRQKQQAYCEQLAGQIRILEQELELAKSQLERNEKLFAEGIISRIELENSKVTHLQKQNAAESMKAALKQAQVSQLDTSILELRLQNDQQRKELELAVRRSGDSLKSAVRGWEYRFVLQAPFAGQVSFSKFWSVNQNVTVGEKVFGVVPQGPAELVGRVVLPLANSGKVKVGQRVRVKLASYPYMEYGQVWGVIRTKSSVPVDNVYALEVAFPKGLHTNYGRDLEFTQEMQGTAEIVTENKRLIERLLSPFKMLLRQNT